MRQLLPCAAVICLLLTVTARADDAPSPSDAAAIRSVISDQLDAFKAGDAAKAESFASPGIRDKFPSPDMFMGMVRGAYGALVGPKSTHFDDLTQTSLGLVQKVTVVDAGGQVWTVAYTMQMIDGQWKISGCFVLKGDSVSA